MGRTHGLHYVGEAITPWGNVAAYETTSKPLRCSGCGFRRPGIIMTIGYGYGSRKVLFCTSCRPIGGVNSPTPAPLKAQSGAQPTQLGPDRPD